MRSSPTIGARPRERLVRAAKIRQIDELIAYTANLP